MSSKNPPLTYLHKWANHTIYNMARQCCFLPCQGESTNTCEGELWPNKALALMVRDDP